MAAPLAGLTGLYGPADNEPHGSTVRDPSNWGTAVDARHHIPGDSSHMPPNYTAHPYPPPNEDVIGAEPGLSEVPGQVRDRTPRTHSAPWPRGLEQDPVAAAEQLRKLHGAELGGTAYLNDGPVSYRVNVDSVLNPDPHTSSLAPGVPDQLRGVVVAAGDVDQGFGHDNSGVFGYGRQQRREYHTDFPFPYTILNAGERPFYGKHPVWQNRLDGDDSPYAQKGDISVAMNLAPQPSGYPTPYEQPSNPTVAPATDYSQAAPVDDYGWVAG